MLCVRKALKFATWQWQYQPHCSFDLAIHDLNNYLPSDNAAAESLVSRIQRGKIVFLCDVRGRTMRNKELIGFLIFHRSARHPIPLNQPEAAPDTMGAFLNKPKTEKFNESATGAGLRYRLSSMQGWRIEMEDAHSALIGIPEIGDKARKDQSGCRF